jgi:hypothetical protein
MQVCCQRPDGALLIQGWRVFPGSNDSLRQGTASSTLSANSTTQQQQRQQMLGRYIHWAAGRVSGQQRCEKQKVLSWCVAAVSWSCCKQPGAWVQASPWQGRGGIRFYRVRQAHIVYHQGLEQPQLNHQRFTAASAVRAFCAHAKGNCGCLSIDWCVLLLLASSHGAA